MSVTEPLRTTARTLRSSPQLLLAAVPMAVLGQLVSVQRFGYGIDSPVATIAVLLAIPFSLTGLVAAADEALDGSPSIRGYLDGVRRGLSLLGAAILLAAAFGFVIFLVAFVGSVVGMVITFGGSRGAGLAGLLVSGMWLLAGVGTFVTSLYVAFTVAATVVSECGPISAVIESLARVRGNLGRVFGFSVVFWVLAVVPQLPEVVLYERAIERVDQGFREPAAVVVASEPAFHQFLVAGTLLGTVALALGWTYNVAFYHTLSDR